MDKMLILDKYTIFLKTTMIVDLNIGKIKIETRSLWIFILQGLILGVISIHEYGYRSSN